MNLSILSQPSSGELNKFVILGLIAFWLAVFLLNAGPHWDVYSSDRELIETAGLITGLQFLVAFVSLNFLVPYFLSTGKWIPFILSMLVLLIVAAEINILVRYLYLEQAYPASYAKFLSSYGSMSLLERMNLGWSMRYIIFSKVPLFILPATLLLAYNYYREQQNVLQMREQKRTAELGALKSQLNPHFIFNTLNNIYALSLKKSDRAPEAIAKLSAILDYVVYRCNQQYVSFDAEFKMIEDFIALEKLRYGNRLSVTIDNNVEYNLEIAPLLILTLIENACKHSTRDELDRAEVSISFEETDGVLTVKVKNTKPDGSAKVDPETPRVGLQNLRKQLQLAYRNKHDFDLSETDHLYAVKLVMDTKR